MALFHHHRNGSCLDEPLDLERRQMGGYPSGKLPMMIQQGVQSMDIYVGYALFHVAINQWGYIYIYVGLYVYRISTINGEIYIYTLDICWIVKW